MEESESEDDDLDVDIGDDEPDEEPGMNLYLMYHLSLRSRILVQYLHNLKRRKGSFQRRNWRACTTRCSKSERKADEQNVGDKNGAPVPSESKTSTKKKSKEDKSIKDSNEQPNEVDSSKDH